MTIRIQLFALLLYFGFTKTTVGQDKRSDYEFSSMIGLSYGFTPMLDNKYVNWANKYSSGRKITDYTDVKISCLMFLEKDKVLGIGLDVYGSSNPAYPYRIDAGISMGKYIHKNARQKSRHTILLCAVGPDVVIAGPFNLSIPPELSPYYNSNNINPQLTKLGLFIQPSIKQLKPVIKKHCAIGLDSGFRIHTPSKWRYYGINDKPIIKNIPQTTLIDFYISAFFGYKESKFKDSQ